MSDPRQLATLDAEAFATKIPAILRSTKDADFEENEDLQLIKSRATEPPAVKAISSILTLPIEEDDFDNLELHQRVLYSIVSALSFEQLQSYRPALRTLASFDISGFKSRSSHYAQTMHLINNAKLLEQFAADREAIWLPINKFDHISDRTLSERVHTAEQMRPYMHGLFNWQVDFCHPVFGDCRKQLARFPETAAAVAAEVMYMAVNDIEHQHYLIDFVSECVPIGEAWIPMRTPVQEMVRSLEGKSKEDLEDDGEDGYLDEAKEWLAKLEKWEASQVS
ncbi:hypothetical protein NW762_012728 [Fusarium torreyae]|uniref:DUF5071 domain-containing protein n=1 Tax=Fusarium torreyae TaxID=1237075 RepID=A0A9W8RLV4_9HYPO|nr:hypothetical protein NW762_012728 [Fusarium torreyae]